MAMLLSSGSSIFIQVVAPARAWASGGVGSMTFSSGSGGGRNRAGRWKASRLIPLLVLLCRSAAAHDANLGHREPGGRVGRYALVDKLYRDPGMAHRERADRLPGAAPGGLVEDERGQRAAALSGGDEELGGGGGRVGRVLVVGQVHG